MKIYVVVYSNEWGGVSVHSAHYSEWMAQITVNNLNRENGYLPNSSQGYHFQGTTLTSEGD